MLKQPRSGILNGIVKLLTRRARLLRPCQRTLVSGTVNVGRLELLYRLYRPPSWFWFRYAAVLSSVTIITSSVVYYISVEQASLIVNYVSTDTGMFG